MFKANRKLTESFRVGYPEHFLQEYDRIFLQDNSLTYVATDGAMTHHTILLTDVEYDELLNVSTELETVDYGSKPVISNTVFKARRATKDNKTNQLTRGEGTTVYETKIKPNLEYIHHLRVRGITIRGLCDVLGVSLSKLYQLRHTEMDLERALYPIEKLGAE